MSFIDPKKQAEEQTIRDWQFEFKTKRDEVVKMVESFQNQYKGGLDPMMMLDIRQKFIVEFIMPAHLDRFTDPTDRAATAEVPTNIERLQYETMWYEVLLTMFEEADQHIQRQMAENGGSLPNGKQKIETVTDPATVRAMNEASRRRSQERGVQK
jgi:hypothetical protein